MSTYARDIELKKFALIIESSEQLITEDADPLSGVLAAKSGTGPDAEATTAWNQLKNDIVAKVNANPPVYTGTLNLTVKGAQVPVEWKVAEDTGVVSYTNTSTKFTATGSKSAPAAPASTGQAKPAPKPSAQPADTAKFDDLTLKLLKAMQDMGTDEEGITDVFTAIKSQDEFAKFAQYFANLRMGYNTYGAGRVTDFAKFKSEAAKRQWSKDCQLYYWIGQELDNDEIQHLNTLLKSNGITSQFISL